MMLRIFKFWKSSFFPHYQYHPHQFGNYCVWYLFTLSVPALPVGNYCVWYLFTQQALYDSDYHAIIKVGVVEQDDELVYSEKKDGPDMPDNLEEMRCIAHYG